MSSVVISMKNGSEHEFPSKNHIGRPNCSVKYEGAFVIVKDEYDQEVAFPAADVEKVKTFNYR